MNISMVGSITTGYVAVLSQESLTVIEYSSPDSPFLMSAMSWLLISPLLSSAKGFEKVKILFSVAIAAFVKSGCGDIR